MIDRLRRAFAALVGMPHNGVLRIENYQPRGCDWRVMDPGTGRFLTYDTSPPTPHLIDAGVALV